MEKKDVFARLSALAASERRVAVATVVRAYGSTPREVGAKMVLLENGDFFGTIGGGCGEAEVWQRARQVFRDGRPATVHVDLTEDPDKGGEAVCGGRMDVFIDLWQHADLQTAGGLVDLLDRGEGVSLATVLDGAGAGERLFVASGGTQGGNIGDAALAAQVHQEATRTLESRRSLVAEIPLSANGEIGRGRRRKQDAASVEVFVEALEQPPCLVIAGAGHCALPLSRLAKMLGFEVVILDDRPECATQERFPDASRILLGDLEAQVEKLTLDANTYVVLVTRGHKLDETILRKIVRRPLAYIGMIGSKRRVRAVFNDMARDGYEREVLDKVYAPIGLDIGAESPEEIAVSIMGEIIRLRNGGTGQSLRYSENPIHTRRAF